jgi:hypothetical protein
MKLFIKNILVLSLLFLIGISFWDYKYINTREKAFIKRRFSIHNVTYLSKKHTYFKEAFNNNILNCGIVAYKMNILEKKYNIPYYWGGDIKNFKPGIDCSGFIHGLMYFSGEINYDQRFNTSSLYRLLKSSKKYKNIYSSDLPNKKIDPKKVKMGDIILWPSGFIDGKNIPGKIIGHVGIVSKITKNITYVTHYVDAPFYNEIDLIGRSGPGINSIEINNFISLKKRGRLNIFRKVN